MSYNEFLQSKIKVFQSEGFEVDVNDFHSSLKPHQRDIVQWACDKGCGLMERKIYFIDLFCGAGGVTTMVKALIEAMYIGLNKLENVKVA